MNAPTAAWTINQLATRVAEVLAAGVPGQVNGRVREVPDVRTLRWYTSIGLLDRPAAMRGRTALYGRRHLMQVVAIKRLQGEGWSLAEIQERLIGADDSVLASIAAVPEGIASGDGQQAEEAPESGAVVARRARFWAAGSADGTGAAVGRDASATGIGVSGLASAPGHDASVSDAADSAAEADATASSRPLTVSHPTTAGGTSVLEAELSAMKVHAPKPAASQPEPPELPESTPAITLTLTSAVHLAPGITLVLDTPHTPEPADLIALAEAARPLLDLLRRLGLSAP